MRRFRLFGIPIRVHPAFFMPFLLGVMSGRAGWTLSLSLSVVWHEMAHMLSARRQKIALSEIELMPFGGAARLSNVWELRPAQTLRIMLSGPLASLFLALLSYFLGSLNCLPARAAYQLTSANLLLAAFNLLPALPLDGGRLLVAGLECAIGRESAVRAGIVLGAVLSAILFALGLLPCFFGGAPLPSLLVTASFLLASGERERLLSGGAGLLSLFDRRRELEDERALPVKWIAAAADAPLSAALFRLSPRCVHRIAVYGKDFALLGVVEEGVLLRAAARAGNPPLGQILREQPVKERPEAGRQGSAQKANGIF